MMSTLLKNARINSTRPMHRIAWLVLAVFLSIPNVLLSQGIERVDPPLIDQQPFDLITLSDDEGGESVKVLPIPFPNRRLPNNPKPTDRIEVVLVRFQERLYEVAWQSIAIDPQTGKYAIGLYERRIYDEAVEKMREKDFVTAFQNLSFLLKNYPKMDGLEDLRQRFIFQSAIDRFGKGELQQTLSALEELKESSPGYRSRDVNTALSRVAGRLIESYQQSGKLGFAKKMLGRLKEKYGPTMAVVQQWDQRLENMALAKKDEARKLIDQGKFREARKAAVEMKSIYPNLPESDALLQEIATKHPMVRVGVMQRGGNLDPTSIIDWPARRSGALVYHSLFKFLETGPEGGEYGFALGTANRTVDRTQLILTLDTEIQDGLTTFELSQELLARADPTHESYDPSWAAIFESVSAMNEDSTLTENQLMVTLNRPNVLPHALLQWILPNEEGAVGSLPGDYDLAFSDRDESAFKVRSDVEKLGQPIEVVEIFYEDPKEAVNDLPQGEIDVLDQLYPADAVKLSTVPSVTVGSYALPTTHMLVPVSDHAYLQRPKFRRALLYATNRQEMLTGELLASTDARDGQLLSGPFPKGMGVSDPLAYAYNPDIQPTAHSPQLAKLLVVMAKQEIEDLSERQRKPIPKLQKLVVGCPDYEFARVAVEAMIAQWRNIDVEAEMLILPSENLADARGCDLLYLVTTLWEPAIDAERLLGEAGVAASDNPFIVQALDKLRAARNWLEVRNALQDLHTLVDYHLPILPLWQITDRFAVRNNVDGLEDNPVSLYQNLINWRVKLGE